MLQTTGVALFIGLWALLYLIDAFLKVINGVFIYGVITLLQQSHAPFDRIYLRFLTHTGLSVSIGQIRWYTSCFNRMFVRIGSWKPNYLKIWFTLGVCFGLVAMLLSVFLLSLLVLNTLGKKPVEQQVLTPVMPGVNLPMNQICYYLMTLLICGVLHEIGHAIAAVREQVRVNGFGIFVLALYPGAFVDLYTEHLQQISPIRQLRIYCAGVWHNFVIVLMALLILVLLPWIMMPFYSLGNGVVITSVMENSAVSGPRGLSVGDHLTSVGGCQVKSMAEWAECIRHSLQGTASGYCLPLDLLHQQDIALGSYPTPAGYVECCSNTSNTHLCFYYHSKGTSDVQYACLPARTTTERLSCKLPSDCYNPNTPAVCVMPSLDNTTRLLRVLHKGRPPLLFLGHPLDLHYSVVLSDYVPSTSLVPVNLPYVMETFCKYLISLSGALALLNVVPCYALDGQWILLAFIELSLRSVISDPEMRGLIYTVLLLFGTILIGTNIIIAMFTLFVW
ncbi:hypothetical protein LSH36_594g02052 [Paralvinella palmiformis]|uniref:Membrane-bound transcription factor site-2 protease n=1 Tax=Paralvinella palmiformis TaxID=53620 RepID=A0AAD9J568_9ANNE|nr:hypothetical protein LSH36_594g02052 [Paralvinella palmiformis]